MRHSLITALLLTLFSIQLLASDLDRDSNQRFADLALACIHKEYPNKIAHVLASDADAMPPRKLTPAFHGCYDWHSAVHGHWLLARLVRNDPEAAFASKAREGLRKSITPQNIAREISYLQGSGRASFERPYGLAWLLQLSGELREWDDPLGRQLYQAIAPLENAVVARLAAWLPKLSHPVRSGEHSQTAFAIGLILDSKAGDEAFRELVRKRVLSFYRRDRGCPLEYEPSGEDFLSPCLAEADAMRRVMLPVEFAAWLGGFLPQISALEGSWLRPAVATDPSDPKLAHLDGLNLSRAWMLEGIASGLPEGDPRIPALEAAAQAHRNAGLAAVTGEHYEGGHWLGSFAVYLVTRRGV
ncbi:MAG TPA: DUF2891 domain-containing protein [Thermoanaerobaculia bacterium]|nr:DUF2891 domain-containing protein [Thermoanaerobaculia bacterium]